MKPTAVSEAVEQTARVAVGLGLGFFLYDRGLDVAAAGATFGAVAGAAAGMLVMVPIYLRSRRRDFGGPETSWPERRGPQTRVTETRWPENRRVADRMQENHGPRNRWLEKTGQRQESQTDILKKILWIAVPIIIGAEIMPLMSAVDMSLVASRLQETGWTSEEALNLYSQYGAYCDTLIALPQTFTQAIAVSLVPSIAACFWQRKTERVRENIRVSMRMTMLLACPCAVGLFVLARPIMLLLYYDQVENALQAAPTLQVMTIGVILLAISQTTTGALQAVGKQLLPVGNLVIGALVKVGVTYVLLGIPAIHVKGAAIGTNAAYLVALALNLYQVKKETGVTFDLVQTYVKPGLAAALMGLCVYASYNIISAWTGNGAATLASIFLGILTYGILVLRMGAVSSKELRALPGGEFLQRVFRV